MPKCYSTRLFSYSKLNINSILYIAKDKIILKSMIKLLTYRNSKCDKDRSKTDQSLGK